MTIVNKNTELDRIRKDLTLKYKCPFCQEYFKISLERDIINQMSEDNHYPYPHIHIHGNPMHAMVCYIDYHFKIRNISVIKSLEFQQDSETFREIIKKWSNPY